MRRIYPLAVIMTAVTLFLLNDRNDSRAEWRDFISNHPYNNPPSLDEVKNIPKRDRPDLAMQQNYLMTVDPNTKTVPTNRLVDAFSQMKTKKGRLTKEAIPNTSWEEKGPNNIGGRTRAVMWDPNDTNTEKLWAAGVAGGIWFNNNITDANSSWQNVDDFMANLAVTTMAYDPTDTQIFYAGTGEGFFNGDAVRGAGIFKSTNAGTSWSLLSSTENGNFAYVQKVIVTQAGTILAATRAVSGTSGVYRSTDDGATFTRMTDVPAVNIADLEEAANGDVYLGTLTSGEVYRSTNDGQNWTEITPAGTSASRIELAIGSVGTTTATTVVYAIGEESNNVGFFKKSVDGGSNWTDVDIPNYREQSCSVGSQDFTRGQAWYDLILAVKPGDDDVVIGGGINVIKSSDGGTSFAEVSYWTGSDASTTCDDYVHADIHAIVFRPGFPNEAIIGSDGGISYSADIGSSSNPSFDSRNKDYNVTQFYAVAAQNTSGVNYFLAGAQDNGTLQFTDGGGLSVSEVTGGDGAFCFIDQDNNNFQISSFIRNVYFLLDGNGNFLQTMVNDQSSGRFINPADYDNTANILYSAGGNDELKRISGINTTPNSQETLSVGIEGGQISAIRADANTANRIFVGTGFGNIYRIDNAESATPAVADITSNISTAGFISSIDIGSSDDELIVTYSNYGAISVWYTSNGGTTWVNKDNDGSLPDMPIRWALFNPINTGQVMLATELGVWSTNNIAAGNPAWEQSSTNLANVRCDMLQYRDADSLVVVATHGRGVFTTTVFSGILPPTDLELTENEGVIELTWTDNATNETKYVIERSIGDENSFSLLAEVGANVEAYNDDVPATNEMIFYRVFAVDPSDENSDNANADILTLPSAPTLLDATGMTSMEFTINWEVSDGATSFVVDVSESEDFSSFLTGFEGLELTDLSATVDNRLSGTYFFRVASQNNSGQSTFSNVGTITLEPLSALTEELAVYPNPATEILRVERINPNMIVELFELSGKKTTVRSQKGSQEIMLDVGGLANGTYLLVIRADDQSLTKTIIKR